MVLRGLALFPSSAMLERDVAGEIEVEVRLVAEVEERVEDEVQGAALKRISEVVGDDTLIDESNGVNLST